MRAKVVPNERNSLRVIEERYRYVSEISTRRISDLIFLDETAFNLHLQSKFAWEPKGLTPSISTAVSIFFLFSLFQHYLTN